MSDIDTIDEFYEVLGLKPGASPEEVKQAYRDLVRVWHPDRFSHDPRLQEKAQEKLKEINEAYERIQFFQTGIQTDIYRSDIHPYTEKESTQSSESQSPPKPHIREEPYSIVTRKTWIHIVLFILTVASTMIVGGPAYSITIILILLGHEMGHYLMSQRYGIKATLPFFLPFPFSPFGTLGAVIRMESTTSSRKALFDTGVAGPLTSLLLSIPAIVIGLRLSEVIPTSQLKEGTIRLGDPLIFFFIQRLVMGEVPENFDILLHPIGYAGWVGLFVTALNLLPVGQLDGGHIAYALFGRRSRAIFLIAIAVMAFITVFYNPGWFLLLILIILFGFRHPAPLDDQTPVDGKRKLVGGLTFLAFILSFTPSPFPQFVEEFKQVFH